VHYLLDASAASPGLSPTLATFRYLSEICAHSSSSASTSASATALFAPVVVLRLLHTSKSNNLTLDTTLAPSHACTQTPSFWRQ
jgi:hypothetical protein